MRKSVIEKINTKTQKKQVEKQKIKRSQPNKTTHPLKYIYLKYLIAKPNKKEEKRGEIKPHLLNV